MSTNAQSTAKRLPADDAATPAPAAQRRRPADEYKVTSVRMDVANAEYLEIVAHARNTSMVRLINEIIARERAADADYPKLKAMADRLAELGSGK